MFTAYILVCNDGTYHFGVTKNMEARLGYHANGENKTAYTFTRRPVQLAFQKSFQDIRLAIAFEKELQAKNAQEIEGIIAGSLAVQIEPIAPLKTTHTKREAIVLPTSYLGNLAYLAQLNAHPEIILDISERFQKQSYRSRCTILSANGLQNLVVPLIRPNGKETLMCDVLVSYAEDWQKDHIKAIESAYRRAPYYEFYAEELFSILRKKHQRLVDLNLELTVFLSNNFGLDCAVRLGNLDEKSAIGAKNEALPKARTNYQAKAYRQVFSMDVFEDNLSSLDLLFNCGKSGVDSLG